MSNSYGRGYGNGDRELNSLVAAGLISGFEESSPGEIYEKALKCFDVLMDVLEDSTTAKKISALMNISAESVKASAQAIIDLLLFNPGNDPYVSLSLPRHARDDQVSRRWKRLIFFYHPDRYSERLPRFDERAKRINEAYEEIRRMGEVSLVDGLSSTATAKSAEYPYRNMQFMGLSRKNVAFPRKYLRRLPVVILVFSLLMTVVSILLFIYAGQW